MKAIILCLAFKRHTVASVFLLLASLHVCLAKDGPERHSFYHKKAADLPSAGDTVRLYFDSRGSLYPPPGYLPGPDFEDAKYKQELQQWYYTAANRAQLNALSRECGVPAFDDTAEDNLSTQLAHWWKIQQVLVKREAAKLDRLVGDDNSARRPLVTLIHGFNTRADEAPFDTTRNTLLREPRLNHAVWLQVYWDGLHKENPIGIWGEAQLNGRYAGFGLRKVLCRIRPDIAVRIFTHSSGAIVACQALWNSTPVAEKAEISALLELSQHIPTPTNTDIRVGMIVPAVTPRLFLGCAKRTVGSADDITTCHPGTGPSYRIIVGQNERDYAVTKNGLFANHFGVTTLACRPKGFDYAKDVCQTCDLQNIDFRQAHQGPSPAPYTYKSLVKNPFKRLEKHCWGLYWQRPQHREFLNMVLR